MRWAACPITLLLFLAGRAETVGPDEHPLHYVWELPYEEQVDLALELLENGSDPERRWIARAAEELLMDLDGYEDDAWAMRRIDRLRSWIAREQDDFVLSLVIRGISDFEERVAGTLFRDLLSHPSPNVRRQAIRFYIDWAEDPAATPILEQMWEGESREWIRDVLMLALASMGSDRFLDEFSERARDDDPDRAALAVEALGYFDDPRAVTELVDLAIERAHPLRVPALRELTYRSESPPVQDVALAASHDDDDEIRRIAISGLVVSEDSPEFAARLREVARSDANPEIRQAALVQLGDDAEVAAILHDIVGAPRTPQTESLARYAEGRLAPRPEPDPLVLEWIERQRAGEEIDWEGLGDEVVVTRIACGGSSRVVAPDTPHAFVLQADPGRATTRCWRAPGVAADFFANERIAAGTWVTIEDYHEYQGELWVELAGTVEVGCWVPRKRLGKTHEAGPSQQRESATLHQELDLFTGDGDFAALWRMAEYGTVEFFDADRGSGVEAVAVDLEPTAARIRGLLDSYRGTEEAIDRLVRTLLRQVPASLALDEELRSRLDALPSAERPASH